jgi:hypothetical protein
MHRRLVDLVGQVSIGGRASEIEGRIGKDVRPRAVMAHTAGTATPPGTRPDRATAPGSPRRWTALRPVEPAALSCAP